MPRFLTGSFLLMILIASAQEPAGFIAPSDTLAMRLPDSRVVYLPGNGFTLFKTPGGEFLGKILPGPPIDNEDRKTTDSLLASTLTGAGIRSQLLPVETYFETEDSCFHVAFNKRENNHVRVSIDGIYGWISLEEIQASGFVLISWMDFYGRTKGKKIHARSKIAPIRKSPSPAAEVIETAEELYSEITSTGKCEGRFCLASVIQFKNPYDTTLTKEENIVKKYKGWIQIVDENGSPLVAHNANPE
jgi:hypothetical protein